MNNQSSMLLYSDRKRAHSAFTNCEPPNTVGVWENQCLYLFTEKILLVLRDICIDLLVIFATEIEQSEQLSEAVTSATSTVTSTTTATTPVTNTTGSFNTSSESADSGLCSMIGK